MYEKDYAELKKLYDKTRLDMFAMALTYIMDKGWSNVKELTDEEIESFKENGLMTKSFVQALGRLARDICNAVENPTEIFQFCDAVSVYETTYFTGGEHLSRRTLEEGLSKLISYALYDEELIMPASSEEETKEQLADLLEIEVEDLETFLSNH